MTNPPTLASHLTQVAGATNGGYTTLTNVGEAAGALSSLFGFATRTLNDRAYYEDQANLKTVTFHSSSPFEKITYPRCIL